jgi:hypothetical protein
MVSSGSAIASWWLRFTHGGKYSGFTIAIFALILATVCVGLMFLLLPDPPSNHPLFLMLYWIVVGAMCAFGLGLFWQIAYFLRHASYLRK